ncbi:hypothetical protein NE237_022739 [Protea cynaroides]|uniref:Uncharacterized protein n=1 Tax=Protea cynaroides TaxID=273540 RepID=A0A9Q0HDS4_9MAGN|nr:hypothetical protein NE237_022739 [Protea cynaroides]
MEVLLPSRKFDDFNFDSACSTPYISAPSTPKRFGEIFCSAPTSPVRASAIYRDFDDLSFGSGCGTIDGSSSAIPYHWEEQIGKSKSNNDDDDDFAFDFSNQIGIDDSLYAEELFDGGVIRPLKPPPRLQPRDSAVTSPRSPRSPRSPIVSQGKKMIRDVFSPRRQRKDNDPFAAATKESRRGSDQSQNRGRDRAAIPSSSRSGRRGTRSVSPLRISQSSWEEQQQHRQENTKLDSSITKQSSSSSTSSSSSSSSLRGSKKWKLRDLLLFRNASEGRASEKDPLRKYSALPKKQQDLKNTSFRTIGSPSSLPSSSPSPGRSPNRSPMAKGGVSAHEFIYTTNRAASEDLKKKTFLPYKPGLLSMSTLSRAFGYFTGG